MGTLKIHHLMTKVQDSKTGRKKKQTRSSLPKLLRFDMGSNVSDSHDFLGTVATNVYWECVCVWVGGCGRGLRRTFCTNNIFYFVSCKQREGKQCRIVVPH